jgi:GNAT superfamily N-acetyltransferase
LIIVRRANTQDAPIVACLVDALLAELGNTPSKLEERAAMAPHLLAMDDRIFGFLAYEHAEPVGVMMVSESHSIYASGAFGVITELYVVPSYRSSGVAQRLIGSGASLRSVPRASPRGPAACNSIAATASPRSVRASDYSSNAVICSPK